MKIQKAGRRIMKMSKILKGSFGAFKSEWIYEWSPYLKEWVGMPVSWYEAKFAN